LMAWLLKKTLLKGEPPMLIMELPPYKRPVVKVALRHMWDWSKLFLQRAGTVILGINIVLWFLATYPRHAEVAQEFAAKRATITEQDAAGKELLKKVDEEEAGENLRRSFAGMAGRAMEPIIKPLGFDWKIGIGLVASFAAREVFNSTMSTIYNIGEGDDSEESAKALADTLREQRRADGTSLYTPLLGVTLMVFYVFALQCVSTVAIVRRETNSWRWPVFQWVYMGVLAWTFAFITYQGGRLLGF
jgi:ferrous iron transport protein B